MTVLFLDFDGVLHPVGGSILPFEYTPLLIRALEPYPAVRIVLSTSWVATYSFKYTRDMLPLELRRRVIDATLDPAYRAEKWWVRASRYEQIAHYVKRYSVERWLAIDDDDDGWPPELRHHLVCPPKYVGLYSADTQAELADKLKSLTS